MAVGPGRRLQCDGAYVPLQVKPGDIVRSGGWQDDPSNLMKLGDGGKKYCVVSEDAILCCLEPEFKAVEVDVP